MQTTPVVELRSVEFHYRTDEPILSDFNVAVEEGELLDLLGPSGCGKSTTMNLVAGLLAPTNGTVLFGGQPLQGVNRGVGYMTQGDTLLPWRTVAANVGLPLSLRNMGRAESSELVDRFLDLLDLKAARSEEHTSELQSLMRISYAV